MKFFTEYNGTYVEFTPDKPIDSKNFYSKVFRNIKYPPIAMENAIQGTVLVTCVVDEKGVLKSADLSKGFYKPCDDEALRIINLLINQQLIEPLLLESNPVKAKFDLPVKFKLQ